MEPEEGGAGEMKGTTEEQPSKIGETAGASWLRVTPREIGSSEQEDWTGGSRRLGSSF
jgi:hypothetical protein